MTIAVEWDVKYQFKQNQTRLIRLRLIEPRREKTGLQGFRPGPTQTGLYKLRSRLEA